MTFQRSPSYEELSSSEIICVKPKKKIKDDFLLQRTVSPLTTYPRSKNAISLRFEDVPETLYDYHQKEVIRKWAIHHLPHDYPKKIKRFSNLFDNLQNLVTLFECLTNRSVGHFTKSQFRAKKYRKQITRKIIRFITNQEIPITLQEKDLVKCNEKKLTFAMWLVTLFFSFTGIPLNKIDPVNFLFEWCKNRIEKYPVIINDFQESFRNGLAFAAILHSKNPRLLDFNEFSPKNGEQNLEKVFTIFSTFGIPQYLNPKDVIQKNYDKHSIIIYLLEIFKKFHTKSENLKILKNLKIPNSLFSHYSKGSHKNNNRFQISETYSSSLLKNTQNIKTKKQKNKNKFNLDENEEFENNKKIKETKQGVKNKESPQTIELTKIKQKTYHSHGHLIKSMKNQKAFEKEKEKEREREKEKENIIKQLENENKILKKKILKKSYQLNEIKAKLEFEENDSTVKNLSLKNQIKEFKNQIYLLEEERDEAIVSKEKFELEMKILQENQEEERKKNSEKTEINASEYLSSPKTELIQLLISSNEKIGKLKNIIINNQKHFQISKKEYEESQLELQNTIELIIQKNKHLRKQNEVEVNQRRKTKSILQTVKKKTDDLITNYQENIVNLELELKKIKNQKQSGLKNYENNLIKLQTTNERLMNLALLKEKEMTQLNQKANICESTTKTIIDQNSELKEEITKKEETIRELKNENQLIKDITQEKTQKLRERLRKSEELLQKTIKVIPLKINSDLHEIEKLRTLLLKKENQLAQLKDKYYEADKQNTSIINNLKQYIMKINEKDTDSQLKIHTLEKNNKQLTRELDNYNNKTLQNIQNMNSKIVSILNENSGNKKKKVNKKDLHFLELNQLKLRIEELNLKNRKRDLGYHELNQLLKQKMDELKNQKEYNNQIKIKNDNLSKKIEVLEKNIIISEKNNRRISTLDRIKSWNSETKTKNTPPLKKITLIQNAKSPFRLNRSFILPKTPFEHSSKRSFKLSLLKNSTFKNKSPNISGSGNNKKKKKKDLDCDISQQNFFPFNSGKSKTQNQENIFNKFSQKEKMDNQRKIFISCLNELDSLIF
ncbi:spectrin beta chain erythrocytic [Anaeramoeba flamelloides]|uniref:Spectrin beta chain erythrocytic n=1 Tax=Anaeramoeba flamelloides TaxID=1746091 RepID=A0AAV7ZS96_9EUKA|nr:spectrin beta chain erythrocytic [Anaeramoeba flamelloides]